MPALFTLPSSTVIWTGVAGYSGDVLTAFLPAIYLGLGIIAGVGIVLFLYAKVGGGIKKVLGTRRGGRGRGRRR